MIRNLALVLLLSSAGTFSGVSTSRAQITPSSPQIGVPTAPSATPAPQTTPSTAPAAAPASTGSMTIPSGTVITVNSPQSGFIKVSKEGDAEVQLAIAKDVTVGGKVAIPVGTVVLGTVQEKDGGAKFVVTQVLINDRLFPLNATSTQKLLSEKVSKEQLANKDLTQQRIEGRVTNSAENVGTRLGYNVGGGIGGDVLGTVGGVAASSIFGGGKVRVVKIDAGQPYLLTVDSAAQVEASTSPASSSAPAATPVTVGAIPPNVFGSGKITEKLSTGNEAELSLKVSPSGQNDRKARVGLKGGSALSGFLNFDLDYLQHYSVGFDTSLAAVEKAKQQGLSGIEKEVYKTEPGPSGAFQKFMVKVSPEGEPNIVVQTYISSLNIRNSAFTVEEVQAFQRLITRLPEAQQKLVQGAQL